MNRIYLPRGWFSRSLILSPHWVSNGHICIKKDLIRNDVDFSGLDVARKWLDDDEEEMDRLTERKDDNHLTKVWSNFEKVLLPFQLTSERLSGGSNYPHAAKLDADIHEHAFINADYLDGLYFDHGMTLWAQNNTSSFFNAPKQEDVTIMLMPLLPKPYLHEIQQQKKEGE